MPPVTVFAFIGWIILASLWFFLPIGIANMSPVLFKFSFKFLARPIDAGIKFRGHPLFGSHKTWRGLIIATLLGGLVMMAQIGAYEAFDWARRVSLFDYDQIPWWSGFLLGMGAIVGDLVKSFIKRRVSIKPGDQWVPFDQIDYILGGLIAGSFVLPIPWASWLVILVGGIILHIVVNHVGYALGMKNTRW